ncbi:hypothetical protein PHLGIDRAFT_36118 [Phlebiopsis gigantea 11061_1 CR5-6]|uniref:C2H2-type domain-containing protein n=1 Tax=Phlebiopsis gigantea (strain 11061_1 CR5-6) TaxID=745531 RepID=A0A0C3S9D2_PHLG1|nr:hypothetical protein PHLGIDRAFT_36118 [Phlebiopsis gigantea 11061_1 CR5-6]
MSPANERISLPSIHEMFPAQSVVMRSPRAPHEGRPHGPHVASDNRVDPSPRSASPPPRSLAPGSPGRSRSSNSDEERKHACPECGKAFNRPSSLAIHVNTHTGAKRCGRRFNVNSNMRRHFRNHTSPHRPLNAASPYTYPLTTAPRALFGLSASLGPALPSACPAPPPPAPYGRGSSASASDDDELSEHEYIWERPAEDARDAVGHMRPRGYSMSSVPQHESPAHSPSMSRRALPPATHRPRSHTYTGAPGYQSRPTVLHPSSEAHRRY